MKIFGTRGDVFLAFMYFIVFVGAHQLGRVTAIGKKGSP